MDLQSQGGKRVTSENALPQTTSVRIPHRQPISADVSRGQPDAVRAPVHGQLRFPECTPDARTSYDAVLATGA